MEIEEYKKGTLLNCLCGGQRHIIALKSYPKRGEDVRAFKCADCAEVAEFVVCKKGYRRIK